MKNMRHVMMSGLIGGVLLTSCQQQTPYPVFFLSEGSAEGTTAKFIVNYNGHTYDKMPIINHTHLDSYHSFMDMSAGSYGVVFTLKPEMRSRLAAATTNKQGLLLLPVVNGLAFQPVRIDRPITDGKLVIWSGLNGYDLKQLARNIRPEDPEREKKRFIDKNPRPLPKLDNKVKKPQHKDHTGRTIGELYASGI